MKTEVLYIREKNTDWDSVIEKAADCIRAGDLVGIPTETVYGLAGSAIYPDAARKIYEAKGRPSDNPLIVHIAKPEDAENIAYTNPLYYELAERFMPGPLTIILPKKPVIPDSVSGGLQTVAIRTPAHPVANALIRVSGHPIAAPSANRSGKPSPTTASHVMEDMNGKIPLILDGGPCSIGVESTVIALQDGGCTILRPGDITAEMLSGVCRYVSVAKAVTDPDKAGDKPESPGMKYKHYSPACQVILVDAVSTEAFAAYVNRQGRENYGVLACMEDVSELTGGEILLLGHENDHKEHTRRLFALLREADERKLDTLYARLPAADGESMAYYNRIIRAAGGHIEKAEM